MRRSLSTAFPPAVLRNVVARDELRLDQRQLVDFRAVARFRAELDRLVAERVRILTRARRNESVRALERLLYHRRTIDRGDEELGALRLLCRELGADRGRVVDREHRVDLRLRSEQVGHHLLPALDAAFRILA